MKDDFGRFMECLKKAGARMEPHYFQLPVAGSEEPIFRERVYCYELYHQLRCAMGDSFHYKLDGEVDKTRHPIIRESPKPDLIVHLPGGMNRNLVVIEVKPVTVKKKEFNKTLGKLRKFLDEAQYYRAIMLIYGNGEYDLPRYIQFDLKKLSEKHAECILLVFHRGPREMPRVIGHWQEACASQKYHVELMPTWVLGKLAGETVNKQLDVRRLFNEYMKEGGGSIEEFLKQVFTKAR